MEQDMKKTYAVKGMLDMRVQLPVGDSPTEKLTVEFTGGQITGYGVAPARYTTSDPAEQRIIERSPLFASKYIFPYGRREESERNGDSFGKPAEVKKDGGKH